MQPQAEPRFKKRVPCKLRVSGSSYAGMVLNVSRGGLFVQTSAQARPGENVWLALNVETNRPAIPIGGKVVWRRAVAPQFRTYTQGGIGLRIESASEPYYQFLARVAGEGNVVTQAADRTQRGVAGPEPTTTGDPFRVHAKQRGGPRSRTVLVRAESQGAARRLALQQLGPDWVVLAVEPAG